VFVVVDVDVVLKKARLAGVLYHLHDAAQVRHGVAGACRSEEHFKNKGRFQGSSGYGLWWAVKGS
jgi:hypothetical protein